MNQPLDPNKKPNGITSGFSDYIRKVQKELSDDYLIEVYISLYLRALRSDGVLNYEEKVWFADRVKAKLRWHSPTSTSWEAATSA